MSTIDELVNRTPPLKKMFIQDGRFKVKFEDWEYSYFMPYFKADGSWFGLDLDGDQVKHPSTKIGWEIYKEPKPKVKHYFWYNSGSGSGSFGEVRFDYQCPGDEEWTKIPGSEVEM